MKRGVNIEIIIMFGIFRLSMARYRSAGSIIRASNVETVVRKKIKIWGGKTLCLYELRPLLASESKHATKRTRTTRSGAGDDPESKQLLLPDPSSSLSSFQHSPSSLSSPNTPLSSPPLTPLVAAAAALLLPSSPTEWRSVVTDERLRPAEDLFLRDSYQRRRKKHRDTQRQKGAGAYFHTCACLSSQAPAGVVRTHLLLILRRSTSAAAVAQGVGGKVRTQLLFSHSLVVAVGGCLGGS